MKAFVAYIARRFLWTIPTVLLVVTAVFFLIRMIPGDPAAMALGDNATPAQIEALRQAYGLDQPITTQYLLWLERLIGGDLGRSITNNQPVLSLVLERFQTSATIVLLAVLLAALVAVPAGLIAAWKQGTFTDLSIVTVATLLLSIPSFWLGLLLLLGFGLKLGWFPVMGTVPFTQDPIQALRHIALPVLTLVLVEAGLLIRMARASAIEVLRLEYVTHARAKGLSERRVLLRHVLPNAFAPVWTVIGLTLGNLLGGIAVLETVFTIPGLGRLMVDSIFSRDYPVLQGCLLLISLIYVFVNLLVDLLYPLFDPKVVAA